MAQTKALDTVDPKVKAAKEQSALSGAIPRTSNAFRSDPGNTDKVKDNLTANYSWAALYEYGPAYLNAVREWLAAADKAAADAGKATAAPTTAAPTTAAPTTAAPTTAAP